MLFIDTCYFLKFILKDQTFFKIMEIFKDSNTKENQEFINLLNNQFQKNKNLSEGKIIEGRITKVTEKIVFVDCGLKSEAIVEI